MDIRSYAESILFGTRLEDKLLSPDLIASVSDHRPWQGTIQEPGRPSPLRFATKQRRRPFPTMRELETDEGRGITLHFFANHELLAMEIMALALLRFPEAPPAFRLGLIQTIREEQEHFQAYLKRMDQLNVQLGDVPVNGFFWDCLKSMQNPLDFVVGMSLTFEQANLDFAQYYRQTFAELGDHETALLLGKVYEDEIGHVKHGAVWLERWKNPEETQWQAYSQRLSLPLSPARAKGLIFDREARRRANLTEEYLDHLYVYAGSKGRVPNLYLYNADCELELSRESPGYNPNQGMRKVMGDLMSCLMFVARPGDVVLTQKSPTVAYCSAMRELGFDLPEFCALPESAREQQKFLKDRRWGRLHPWGWTPRTLEIAQGLHTGGADLPIDLSQDGFWRNSWMELFRKSALPQLRRDLRQELGDDDESLWGPREADGALLSDLTDILVAIGRLHAAFGTPAVIKSPYGFAGSGMLRAYPGQDLSEAQIGWIERQLELYGAVLIEPWLKRVTDLSVVWSEENTQLSSFVFYTNAKGQYKGHSLQTLTYALTPEQRAFLFETKRSTVAGYEQLLRVAGAIRQKLADHGYRYAAGIDTMIYEWKGRWYLRVLGEVNCRMTMGHIARGLRKHVNPAKPSLWQSVTVLEAQSKGWSSLTQMADEMQRQFPPIIRHSLIESGIFFSNDPAQSNYILGLVAVGKAAIAACEGMGALGASTQPTT